MGRIRYLALSILILILVAFASADKSILQSKKIEIRGIYGSPTLSGKKISDWINLV